MGSPPTVVLLASIFNLLLQTGADAGAAEGVAPPCAGEDVINVSSCFGYSDTDNTAFLQVTNSALLITSLALATIARSRCMHAPMSSPCFTPLFIAPSAITAPACSVTMTPACSITIAPACSAIMTPACSATIAPACSATMTPACSATMTPACSFSIRHKSIGNEMRPPRPLHMRAAWGALGLDCFVTLRCIVFDPSLKSWILRPQMHVISRSRAIIHVGCTHDYECRVESLTHCCAHCTRCCDRTTSTCRLPSTVVPRRSSLQTWDKERTSEHP
jgi:hypothetical protein